MVIRISKEALRTVFASEIDIKQIGYSESDLSGAPEATIKAKCMLLQIGANQKLAFHDQITYFKKQELNQFKLESIDFISERPDQITGMAGQFRVGCHRGNSGVADYLISAGV